MQNLVLIALSQYGIKEIPGEKHNPIIVNYAKEAGFTWVNDDETPWCSIFVNWVAKKANKQHSMKANARSWLNIGTPVTTPTIGDIIVLSRGTNPLSGHVGFYINDVDGDKIYLLGGNQSNSVNISIFSKKDILGIRRLS